MIYRHVSIISDGPCAGLYCKMLTRLNLLFAWRIEIISMQIHLAGLSQPLNHASTPSLQP